jgi:hypothetical protein
MGGTRCPSNRGLLRLTQLPSAVASSCCARFEPTAKTTAALGPPLPLFSCSSLSCCCVRFTAPTTQHTAASCLRDGYQARTWALCQQERTNYTNACRVLDKKGGDSYSRDTIVMIWQQKKVRYSNVRQHYSCTRSRRQEVWSKMQPAVDS